MKKLFSVLFALLACTAAESQYSLVQQVNPGPNAWVEYNQIASDQQGNLIFSGRIYNTSLAFGGITLTAGTTNKWFVAKMDAGHNWQWARAIEGGTGAIGSIHNMTTDNSGNIYLTGWFEGNVLFDNISLTSTGSSNTSWTDLFVAKMNSSGSFLWAKKEGTKNGSDQGFGIALDGSGNVYVTGHMTRKTIQDRNPTTLGEITDIYLVKYNNSGTKLWEKKFTNGVTGSSGLSNGDGRDLFGRKVIADASGNIYFTGGFYGTVSFGTGSGLTVSANKRSAFLAKLNSGGTAQWVKTAIGNGNGSGADQGSSLFIDGANNVFWGGLYWGTSSVIGNITVSGQHNFLARYSSNGTLAWAVNIPNNDYYNSIGDVNVKIFRGSLTSLSVLSQSYGFLEISSSNGSIISQDSFTGWNTTGNAGIWDVATTASGHIFTGKVLGTVGLGNMTLSTGCEPYDSCFDDWIEHAYIATYTIPATKSTRTITNEHLSAGLTLYPNPAANQITINGGGRIIGSVSILDASGRLVHQEMVGNSQATISLRKFLPGVYYLRVDGSGKAIKFIKH